MCNGRDGWKRRVGAYGTLRSLGRGSRRRLLLDLDEEVDLGLADADDVADVDAAAGVGDEEKVPALDAQSARYHAPRTQLILAWSGETVRSLRSVSAQRADEPMQPPPPPSSSQRPRSGPATSSSLTNGKGARGARPPRPPS